MPNVRFDNGLAEITPDGAWDTVAEGLGFAEGPLWLPAGYLIFSDTPGGRICEVRGGALGTHRELQGEGPDGLTLDIEGRLLVCFQDGRWVGREEDGRIEPLAREYDGRRLNSPNDIVVRSDGRIFFSDPPYGLKDESARQLPYNAVFTVDPDGSGLRPLATDFEKPNGLALSLDERTLYVADTARHHVRAFDVAGDGELSDGRVFAGMREEGRPDGMKLDRDGRLYVCAGSLQVFAPDGKPLGVIDCPQSPANCTWGEDGSTLFITARTCVYRSRIEATGVAPYLR
ncbi:MAG: SMP-30/gluconolactonase/LRE family protein [Dehalococcoidia bacterium]|nr:SMP-30/gluconolactonase/LRE family protein [Dehalococcoidia bacterium]